jgi:hypothetical protein
VLNLPAVTSQFLNAAMFVLSACEGILHTKFHMSISYVSVVISYVSVVISYVSVIIFYFLVAISYVSVVISYVSVVCPMFQQSSSPMFQ